MRKATELMGCSITATDGDIGRVSTLLFDDERWTVRYFVVDTGKWLPGRKVLISPISIQSPNWTGWTLNVSLTHQEVKNSPDIETNPPVSRQRELDYYRYYGYPHYWGGMGLWGAGAYPEMLARTDEARAMAAIRDMEETGHIQDSHLRDVKVVAGYHLRAADGEIGHVEDFLIDDRSWAIRYLLIDTSNWLGGRRVLVSPSWVTVVSWDESRVHLAVTRQAVKDSPPYKEGDVNRVYEDRLYSHYGRQGYWTDRDVDRDGDDDLTDAAGHRFARLEDLDDVEVADDEPDVRGWQVIAADGIIIGSVEHLIVDRPAVKVRFLEVGLKESVTAGERSYDVLIPLERVDFDVPARQVRVGSIPSARVPSIPPFAGFPISAQLEQRIRAHFGTRDGREIEPDVHLTERGRR